MLFDKQLKLKRVIPRVDHITANFLAHQWVNDWAYPTNTRIIQLCQQLVSAISLFVQDSPVSRYIMNRSRKDERDDPTLYFYHANNFWSSKGSAQKKGLDELRTGLMRLPLRREDGDDAYNFETWRDFRRELSRKGDGIYAQLANLEPRREVREKTDAFVKVVRESDSLIPVLVGLMQEVAHWFFVKHQSQGVGLVDLFDQQQTGLRLPMFLGASKLSIFLDSDSMYSYEDINEKLMTSYQKATLRDSAIGLTVSTMLTLSGYTPAVAKYIVQRLKVDADTDVLPFLKTELTGRKTFIPSENIEVASFGYIMEYLANITEGYKPPVKQTFKQFIQESDPRPEAEKDSTSMATAMLVGAGVLMLLYFM